MTYPFPRTVTELRKAFWNYYPQFKRKGRTRQNDYPREIRLAWCDYVEHCRICGDISESLANKATL